MSTDEKQGAPDGAVREAPSSEYAASRPQVRMIRRGRSVGLLAAMLPAMAAIAPHEEVLRLRRLPPGDVGLMPPLHGWDGVDAGARRKTRRKARARRDRRNAQAAASRKRNRR